MQLTRPLPPPPPPLSLAAVAAIPRPLREADAIQALGRRFLAFRVGVGKPGRTFARMAAWLTEALDLQRPLGKDQVARIFNSLTEPRSRLDVDEGFWQILHWTDDEWESSWKQWYAKHRDTAPRPDKPPRKRPQVTDGEEEYRPTKRARLILR